MNYPNRLTGLPRALLLPVFTDSAFAKNSASLANARSHLGNSAALADFNHDGILDIDHTSTAVHIHVGLGNGAFPDDESVNVPASSIGAENIAVASADLNGEGLPDLTVGQDTQIKTRVLLATAASGFAESATYSVLHRTRELYFADLNLDGKPDLVVVGNSGVSVRLGNGNGAFQRAVPVFLSGEIRGQCRHRRTSDSVR